MWALIKREINGFFNGLIAYVVLAVFLIIIGLFLWVFPSEYNVMKGGHADLNGFFSLAPFVFLFLIPAVTMRFLSDEFRSGTYEMLVTKPLTSLQIVFAKYFAGVVLVAVALLPTLIFYASLRFLSAPPGVDLGGLVGSYAGLFLLGMVFVAVGLFASSLTRNQIVAFVISLFLSGFLYIGFEMIHRLEAFDQIDQIIRNIGLYPHYSSMGRGVIDSRDVLYFFGVIIVFLTATNQVLNRKTGSARFLTPLLSILLIVLAVQFFGQQWFVRLDMTADKRYSLSPATKRMLQNLDDVVFFRVYLDGDLPSEFRRFRNETRDMLDEFNAWSGYVQYEFISPSRAAGDDPQELRRYYRKLAERGLEPAQVQTRAGDASSQRVIFPGALVSYKGREVPVHLLHDNPGLSVRDALHQATMAIEYKLASSVLKVTRERKEKIAFLQGQGELEARYVESIYRALEDYYHVDRISIAENFENLGEYRTLISAKPRQPFSEAEKYLLDQFLMQGGSMLWLVDPVFADMDSLMVADETLGIGWDINLDDFFFRYGVRLNPVLLKDLNAAPIPVTTGFVGGRPQINLIPWPFFPVLNPTSRHEIVNNLNFIRTEFISSIDTVEAPGVEKTILLESSPYTRVMPVPVRISLDLLEHSADEHLYAGPPQSVAVLLEGTFPSLYRNRVAPTADFPTEFNRRDESLPAAMIVVADGDLIRNQVGSDGRILPLGYDRFTGQTFANKDFILNAVNYLTDDSGIISARSREARLRLLDRQRVNSHKATLQLVNTLMPILLVLVFGAVRLLFRKRYHSK